MTQPRKGRLTASRSFMNTRSISVARTRMDSHRSKNNGWTGCIKGYQDMWLVQVGMHIVWMWIGYALVLSTTHCICIVGVHHGSACMFQFITQCLKVPKLDCIYYHASTPSTTVLHSMVGLSVVFQTRITLEMHSAVLHCAEVQLYMQAVIVCVWFPPPSYTRAYDLLAET